jgi:hypothetical protein
MRIRQGRTAIASCAGIMLSMISVSFSAQAFGQADPDPMEAQVASDFAINDEDPESSVPTPAEAMKKPLHMGYHIMLLSERADAATKRGDHAAAAKFWRALGKASPERALPFVRACKSSEAAGDLDKARESCRAALGKQGVTTEDYAHFVQLVLSKPSKLTESDIADVDAIAGHFKEQITGDEGELQQNRTLCQLGSRLSDVARLKACTARLQVLAPKDPQTLVYSWSAAMLEHDFDRASLVSAQKSQLAAKALATMQESLKIAREQQTGFVQRLLQSWPVRAMALVTLISMTLLVLYKRRPRHVA